MAHAFTADGQELVAIMDEDERAVVAGLCLQVMDLVAPTSTTAKGDPSDPFEAIVAGLGDLATDTEDGAAGLDVPDRAFGLDHDRDPALDRLFPTGNREDEQEAAEFRRFTEQGLRQRKHQGLTTTVRTLEAADDDRWVVTRAQAPAVLIALTDIRLVMGERLGLRTDEDANRLEELIETLDADDPAVFALSIYDFLTWLQESLTQALIGEDDE
ncbi:hypothetical protein ASG73_08940 [Janibacter sp. Soil728]|uniref:DUF2017 domain-containing protein n=1 Tax=Janibacter sp. Soil728 TaxID=1736393 RepID=UPI0006F73A28|nr:DUF2017 domain-containing protein [Janibacter sp. Soil728]KRE37756.1 hypothetical protein ASG73_08940 [Janibacter sp. Soil728]